MIFRRFPFLGKDAHFRNFFRKHLWKIFLGRSSQEDIRKGCVLETSELLEDLQYKKDT